MFDEYGFLKRETLTETAQKFKFPAFKLVNLWREAGAVNDNLDGIFAKWKVEALDDTLDTDVVAPEAKAQPMDLTPRGYRSAQMLLRFKEKSFPAEFMNNVQDAESIVATELMLMRKKAGDQFDEAMLAQALQGSISVTYDGQTVAQSTGIPAANTNSSSYAWGATSSDILGDVETDRQLIEGYGYEPYLALTTGKVFNAMKKDSVVKDYLARNNIGLDSLVKGYIPDLFGLQWMKYDLTYKNSSGTRTRFLTEGKVIIIPRPSPEWTEFQIGKVAQGMVESGQGVPNFPMVNGWASWFEAQGNPPGFKLYGRYASLPVFKVPDVITVRDTLVT